MLTQEVNCWMTLVWACFMCRSYIALCRVKGKIGSSASSPKWLPTPLILHTGSFAENKEFDTQKKVTPLVKFWEFKLYGNIMVCIAVFTLL